CGQFARQRELADVDQGRMRQGADRVERQVAPQLQPDFRADVLEHRRLEAAALEHFRHALRALGDGAVQFTDREAVAFDVMNDARSGQLGSRIDDAAEDAARIDGRLDLAARIDAFDRLVGVRNIALALEIPPRNPVLHRDDDGVLVQNLVQIGQNGLDLMGFHTQNHHVLRTGIVPGAGANVFRHALRAVVLDQLHAVGANGFEIGATNDDSNVILAAQGESHRDQTTDRAGADYAYFHAQPPIDAVRMLGASFFHVTDCADDACAPRRLSTGT